MRIKTNCPVRDLFDQAVENWYANRTPAQFPDSRRCYNRYGTSVSCGMLEVCPLSESVSAKGGRLEAATFAPYEPTGASCRLSSRGSGVAGVWTNGAIVVISTPCCDAENVAETSPQIPKALLK